ncbi:superoxide dismutase [Pseudoxanthomonas broegbernensis]|uniref:Superoxide dismutase [Cu-Zn] n=1 Tax=Pseudoxanthomonas broegbernensis TaxID=83619 RepID=A0A7V8GNG8_9GAMM|nr:superoxide dismutase family protein [Pseudoxanthomonas broegbernensis]KAF1686972.1 superoxide dismutase [Pseudoxanthomonas broegbernensis]MBB6065418.1 Cu-Zn family superoxide dismutase [Pseudoxanthomonas broegbernensis]
MRIPLATLGLFALAACSSAPPPAEPAPPAPVSTAQQATAVLASASGSRVSGKLTLAPMGDGVHIGGEVGGLTPNGQFGFHVHEKGDCSAVDASSAGGHFNPAGTPHGRAGTPVHHAGDMDNIVSDASGVARVNVHLHGVTLGGGAANDIAGRAVIVHAAADDYHSQPAGNAGARVACGLIRVP